MFAQGYFQGFLPNGRWYMPQDPFPLPPGDAAEPDGAALPATEGTGPGDDPDGIGQGLYICAPAEQLTLTGFAQGGEADTMTPGPLLATVVHTVAARDGAGLAGCSDDQLAGILSAGKRMESWAAWIQMAAMREFAARYPGSRPEDEFAADELACELHLTPLSVRERIDFACTVARRLPQTFAALSEGRIHPVHVRIIEDDTVPDPRAGRHGRRGPRRGRPGPDVRRAAGGRAQAGPEAGPRDGQEAEGSSAARSPRAPVPGGIRQRRNGGPGTALR